MKTELLIVAALFAAGCGGGETIVEIPNSDGGGSSTNYTSSSASTASTGTVGQVGGQCGNTTCSATQQCCFVPSNGQNVPACLAAGSCNPNGGSSSATATSTATSSSSSTAAAACTATSCTTGVCCSTPAAGGGGGGGGGGAPTLACQARCTGNSQELCTGGGGGGGNAQGSCPTGFVCRAQFGGGGGGGGGGGTRVCQAAPAMDAGAPPPRDAGAPRDAATGG
jgi:hypothetical protein